jgi:hypothetical protein
LSQFSIIIFFWGANPQLNNNPKSRIMKKMVSQYQLSSLAMANIPLLVWTMNILWFMTINVSAQQGSPATMTLKPTSVPAIIQDGNELDSCFLAYYYFDSKGLLEGKRNFSSSCEFDKNPLIEPASCTLNGGSTNSSYPQICSNELDGNVYFLYYAVVCTELLVRNTTSYPITITYNYLNNPICYPKTCSDDSAAILSQQLLPPLIEQAHSTNGSICFVKEFGISPTILTSRPPVASPMIAPTNQDSTNKHNNNNPTIEESCYLNLYEIESMYPTLNVYNTEPIVDCIMGKNTSVSLSSQCTVDDDPTTSTIQQLCLNVIGGKFFLYNFILDCTTTTRNGTEYTTQLNYSKNPLCFPSMCTEDELHAISTDYHEDYENVMTETGDTFVCVCKDGVLTTNNTMLTMSSPSSVSLSLERNMTTDSSGATSYCTLAFAAMTTIRWIDMGKMMLQIGIGTLLLFL